MLNLTGTQTTGPNPNANLQTGITAASRTIEDRLVTLETATKYDANEALTALESRIVELEAVIEKLRTKVAGL